MLSLFGRRLMLVPRHCLLSKLIKHGTSNNNGGARSLLRTFSSEKERLVIALGGNALLRRGEEMTMENQRKNVREGAASLKEIVESYNVTLVHGNGPQSGLLVLESSAYEKQTGLEHIKLDVIDAETEGMIGYLLEQELQKYVTPERGMATILSQILVDQNDPAFQNPTKFIGPVYTKEEADKLNLPVKSDGEYYRRVVPSPRPIKMLDHEMRALQLLTDADCLVICAGGGGIPVVQDAATGELTGVEAVIDKDRAACMVAASLKAPRLLILTDVTAVATDYKTEQQKWIRTASPGKLQTLMDHFPPGSMGPKVESAIEYVQNTGGWAAIGSLNEANKILEGVAGTRIVQNHRGKDGDDDNFIEYHDE